LRTIAVLNQKGGVGKTTTTTNLAAALAAKGFKVAAIDLDPQSHLTIHLGLNPETIEAGAYKVLTQQASFEDEMTEVRKNLWLLAANINLVGAESELVSVVGRETILREAVDKIKDRFDYILIDCAPSLGLLTLNALACAEEVLIPLQPHFLALQGFGKLLQTIDLVNKRINPNLKVKGVLLCMFDSRASLPNEVKADIEQFLESARGTNCAWSQAEMLPVYIRRNIKLAEAPSYGKTIFEYEENCNGAQDYRKVAEFFCNNGKLVEPIEDEITQESPEANEADIKRETIENSLTDNNESAEELSQVNNAQTQSQQTETNSQRPAGIEIKEIKPASYTIHGNKFPRKNP
jgi:chromosome partitioning protein